MTISEAVSETGFCRFFQVNIMRKAAEHIACAAGDFSEAEEYLRDQAQALISSWHCVLHKQ